MQKDYIYLNGEKRNLGKPLDRMNIRTLLSDCGVDLQVKGLAIAVNTHVIPKSECGYTTVKAKDRIEIVRPFSGG